MQASIQRKFAKMAWAKKDETTQQLASAEDGKSRDGDAWARPSGLVISDQDLVAVQLVMKLLKQAK